MKIISRVNLKKQWKKEEKKILPEIKKILRSGDYVGSNVITKLEKKLARYNKSKYCVCTNSGTDALTLALYATGIKKGDEVITPANSFIASTASIVHLGARPVFVDVKNDQLIDENKIVKFLSKKTKAIMPVHLCGRVANMEKIVEISKKYNLKIIEDCAQAIGSKYNNKFSGTFGDIGCFSTHPLKNLNACGDGGFVLTNNKDYYLKIKKLINHGLVDRNNSETFGYVSRMDSLQAMIVMKRLDNLNYVIKKRRENAELYFEYLKDAPVVLPYELKQEYNTYHLFVIQTKNRDELIKFLKLKKIETGIHYPIPIHKQAAYKNMFKEKLDLPNTEEQANQILSLPINEFLTKNQILYICNSIKKFFE